jgi:alpha-galactosidase
MEHQVVDGATIDVPVGEPERFYAHGWHSWCRTAWVAPDQPRHSIADRVDRLGHDDPVHAFDDTPGGSAVGAVAHGKDVTLIGALAPGGWVALEENRLVGAYEDDPGRWFVAHGDVDDVFHAYATALADHLGRRGGDDVRLWCSWYSYYEDIDEGRITAAIDGLGDLPFDTIQIDDGWQQAIGDWTPNAKFSAGMASLAGRIRDTDRRAGLWLAPFIAAPDSDLAMKYPGILLRDDAGEPVVAGENWGSPYYALDVTHPATEAHLSELFSGLRDLGFEFFKLDFIYAAAFPGRRSSGMGREAAYRYGLETIRRAVGDDSYLLACGAPIVASVGICDGIRIGPDVGPWWVDPEATDPATGRGARNAMTTSLNRLWLRPAIDTDPDVAFFRSRDLELDDTVRRRVQQLARIAGVRGCSDPPGWLTDEERASLHRFLVDDAAVHKIGPLEWMIGDASADFAPIVAPAGVDGAR